MRYQHTLCSLLGLIGFSHAYAIPDTYAVHEKRDASTPLPLHKRVDGGLHLPMRIGLKQNEEALASAEAWLMDVSHPASAQYGKHWTQDKVIEAFQPSDDSVDAVRQWLKAHGIMPVHSDNKAWLAFDIPAEQAEKLLHTEYYEHELSSGRSIATCEQYHVPQHLQRHIDYITPGVKGSDVTARLRHFRRAEAAPTPYRKGFSRQPTEEQKAIHRATNVSSIAHCDKLITPACIQAAYDFTNPAANASVCSSNSLGIFEEGDTYSQRDLDLFFKRYTNIPNGTHPILDSIDGGKAPKPCSSSGCGESDLDFELAIPIIYPQTTTLYQTDDAFEVSSKGLFNTFLDAIDGSYCTYSAYNETGNSPIDPHYPDPHKGGYKGQLMCGTYKPTNVISISYGVDEEYFPANYQRRQCDEFLKLSLQGVSIFVASGDYGVGPSQSECPRGGKVFVASQPNGCPWLTNVGATTIEKGKTVHDPEVAAQLSGGGFSNLFAAPSYQLSAIDHYYKTANVSYPYFYNGNWKNSTGIYNRNGRGIPDVSAFGLNIATYSGGVFSPSGGTSASAPIVAALFNRIIEERIKIGKGALGFVNPTLYQHPEVLNDVVKGHNPGCGTRGFECAPGWDPVTGLGTPNYPKLLQLFLDLP